jgi:hypothetical protein
LRIRLSDQEHAEALHRRYCDFWLVDGELELAAVARPSRVWASEETLKIIEVDFDALDQYQPGPGRHRRQVMTGSSPVSPGSPSEAIAIFASC